MQAMTFAGFDQVRPSPSLLTQMGFASLFSNSWKASLK
jgi:hypothetical protein